jgi:hypothetical protein
MLAFKTEPLLFCKTAGVESKRIDQRLLTFDRTTQCTWDFNAGNRVRSSFQQFDV